MYYFTFIFDLQKLSSTSVTIDCANGVGADKLRKLSEQIDASILNLTIVNDGSPGSGKLNENCGADYVKIQQQAPNGKPNYSMIVCEVIITTDFLTFLSFCINDIFS